MKAQPHGSPRAILFDWDNTLVDNWPVISDSMNEVFSAFGMPQWTLAETKARTRASLRDSFPRLFGERAKEAGRIFSDHFASRHLAERFGSPLMPNCTIKPEITRKNRTLS